MTSTNKRKLQFFGCSGLTNITISNSITTNGNNAFQNCTGLINIIIPNSVTSMGAYTFSGCSALTSIEIPESVTSIGESAFSSCYSLTGVTIPNSVISIGMGAFYGCINLASITIPASVTSIGMGAFYDCTALTSIYLLIENPIAITNWEFSNYDATLYVPQGSLEAYKVAEGWKEFKNIVEFDPTGIEDETEDDAPTFEMTAGGIQFTAADGKAVAVYTVGGAIIERISSYAGEEITLDKGVYILRVGDKAVKVKL